MTSLRSSSHCGVLYYFTLFLQVQWCFKLLIYCISFAHNSTFFFGPWSQSFFQDVIRHVCNFPKQIFKRIFLFYCFPYLQLLFNYSFLCHFLSNSKVTETPRESLPIIFESEFLQTMTTVLSAGYYRKGFFEIVLVQFQRLNQRCKGLRMTLGKKLGSSTVECNWVPIIM